MARIRTIKPDFFKNEDLSDLDPIYRLLFIGLWTQADREGKLEDRPKRLKIEIFPYDDFDMDKGLDLLHEKGFIIRYNIDENPNNESTVQAPYKHSAGKFIKILTFAKHQQPNVKEASSGIPDPVFHKAPYEHSASTVRASQEGKGKEGNGEQEREGNGITPHHDIDMILVDKILKFFGFNQVANHDKVRVTGDFVNCININNQKKYFEDQFDAYIEYKTLNDSFTHSFKNFLGNQSELYSDGAWNAENWIHRLQLEKEKNTSQKEASKKSTQTKFEKMQTSYNEAKNPYLK